MFFVHINREKDIDIAFAQHAIDEYKVALQLYSIFLYIIFCHFCDFVFSELNTIIYF